MLYILKIIARKTACLTRCTTSFIEINKVAETITVSARETRRQIWYYKYIPVKSNHTGMNKKNPQPKNGVVTH